MSFEFRRTNFPLAPQRSQLSLNLTYHPFGTTLNSPRSPPTWSALAVKGTTSQSPIIMQITLQTLNVFLIFAPSLAYLSPFYQKKKKNAIPIFIDIKFPAANLL